MTSELDKIVKDTRSSSSWLMYRRVAGQIRSMQEQAFANNVKIAFAGTFTIDPLADYTVVESAADSIYLTTYLAPYGQFNQELLNPQSGLYAFGADVTFLSAQWQSLTADPLSSAEQIIALALNWKRYGYGILLLSTFVAEPDWPLHVLQSERQQQVQKANQKLREAFALDAQVQVFELDALAAYAGFSNALSPEMVAMARVPFSETFLKLIAQKICSHIKAHKGLSKKCLVVDCDNTLWGGIIGEDGIDGIALGPDWPGREFVEFQKAILELYEQGVILAINSKNNEADVLDVLRRHPHMILREEHFAALVINWQSKPNNMPLLSKQLNIGLDSMVFIDDNPAERQLMQQAYPEVEVIDLPSNPAFYEKALRETSFFSKTVLSDEDRNRGRMYAAQRRRSELQKAAVSIDEFLKSLEMVCTIRYAGHEDIKRAAQLTQRTNQFNLTTKRYSEAEINKMVESPDWNVYVLGLKDKFGDNGIVGLAIVQKQNRTWRVDSFLMSCRVIGRQAENALVDFICRDAMNSGTKQLEAEYIQTSKNALAADFWDKMSFTRIKADSKSSRYQFELNGYKPKTFEYLIMENTDECQRKT